MDACTWSWVTRDALSLDLSIWVSQVGINPESDHDVVLFRALYIIIHLDVAQSFSLRP
jgi:hypothetical protein